MRSRDIREEFYNYFMERGHTRVKSSPLIPVKDPTILFTNAGMVQFKRVFLGEEKRDYLSAVSIQKCMRAGGKHNDLENVGRTARHHTFFEMLGNFSFGDYFKEGAIEMGWGFLTERLHLPPERLWITIFREDNDAYRIWRERIGIPSERIVRMGEKDNFWQMGEIGPCGPCSEIIIDQGIDAGCNRPECRVGCDCDRFLELWNLVFMQFDKDKRGNLTPLPKPSIDTGMGLERITTVTEGMKSNYDSDLFTPLIYAISDMAGLGYRDDPKKDISIQVISDHIRAITFLITDGVFPANEGRGYVLRRIIRRGAWHGNLLNLKQPFLFRLTNVVIDNMKDIYPELREARDMVSQITQGEEERFDETMKNGLEVLEDAIKDLREKRLNTIPGKTLFKLYDTYGLPFDLISEIAGDERLLLDHDGFEAEMDRQRQRSKESYQLSISNWQLTTGEGTPYHGLEPTTFVGYEMMEAEVTVIRLINSEGEKVERWTPGEEIDIILDFTPFYGESGGQVGDKGVLSNSNTEVEIIDTIKTTNRLYLHKGRVVRGEITVGERYTASVDRAIRADTARNHTATHILHSVLREVLGRHVRQAGSLVASDRLRFDFTHFSPVDEREIERIEDMVNSRIRDNYPVITEEMDLESARSKGAIALFEEEYGEVVRVVQISDLSMELCGGTHSKRTGDIAMFKIVHEGGVASGIRRIEAITGEGAYRFIKREEATIDEIAELLKVGRDEVISKIKKILVYLRERDKEIDRLKRRLTSSQIDRIISDARSIGGIKVISKGIESFDLKELRSFADSIKERLGSGIIVVGSKQERKVSLVAVVTKDLIVNNRFHAGKIIKEIAAIVGGSGGGRPDMAQAGGKDINRLDHALEKVYEIVERGIKG